MKRSIALPAVLYTALVLSLVACGSSPASGEPATRIVDAAERHPRPEGPRTDANGNGVEDALDIALGASLDQDGNGIPDEAEAPAAGPRIVDANGNGIEDSIDIATGTSLDEDSNGIPDDGESDATR